MTASNSAVQNTHTTSVWTRVRSDVAMTSLLGAIFFYFGGWVIAAWALEGYHFSGWWWVGHIVVWALMLIAFVTTLTPDQNGAPWATAAFWGAVAIFILSLMFPALGAVAEDEDEVVNDPEAVIADLVDNACPNGVDDTTNWPEQADTDFALAAGPSLLGQTPSEILSSWYGEDGRGCSQAAKELQATAALRAADVGLDDGQFINQLRPRFLNESNLWEDSVDATAPIFSNLLANEYREEVVFKDRDAYCVTVLNDHTVTQVEAVFVNPVSGFEGLPSLPESVEEGPHVWYLPAYDIFCREAPFEHVPVTEGVVELGKEAEEERVAAEEEVEESTTTTAGTDKETTDTNDTAAEEPTDNGETGEDTGEQDGDDNESDADEGAGDDGGDKGEDAGDCDTDDCGTGGGGGDDDDKCKDGCKGSSTSTTSSSSTTTTVHKTTTTTRPSTTTTTKPTTTTTMATTTTTKPTTTTTMATTTTTKPTTTTSSTTSTSTPKGTAPCNPFDPDCDDSGNSTAGQEASASTVIAGVPVPNEQVPATLIAFFAVISGAMLTLITRKSREAVSFERKE